MAIRIDADLLIPGRGEPISGGSVVMDGGVISFVGPSAEAPHAGETVTVSTVMPGLWECHAHFMGTTVPNLEPLVAMSPALAGARAAADVAATLLGGVTSAREVGGYGIDVRHAIEEGSISGPRIYAAGSVLSTTGGHADVHGLPLDWIHSTWNLGVLCDGVPEVLKAVRKQLRKGADVIKICASGGVMSEIDHPIHQQFSGDELRAIVEEAGRAERVVAAHCHGKPGMMAALEAGVKTIEHGSYLDEEVADAMKETGAILVPTRYVVNELLGMEDRLPPYAYRKGVMIAEQHALALKTAIAAGVTIAMGTDIFVSGSMYGTNSREIRHLVDAGLAPLDAIEAATANGPLTLGPQAPASGRLTEGYDADVIALDFDPLADVAGWGDPSHITHVWKGGESVKSPATS